MLVVLVGDSSTTGVTPTFQQYRTRFVCFQRHRIDVARPNTLSPTNRTNVAMKATIADYSTVIVHNTANSTRPPLDARQRHFRCHFGIVNTARTQGTVVRVSLSLLPHLVHAILEVSKVLLHGGQ